MFTLIIAQRLGLKSDFVLGLSVFEGVCMTIAVMLLVERYLFSPTGRIPATAEARAEPIPVHAPSQTSR
jgi:hypothetical protein